MLFASPGGTLGILAGFLEHPKGYPWHSAWIPGIGEDFDPFCAGNALGGLGIDTMPKRIFPPGQKMD